MSEETFKFSIVTFHGGNSYSVAGIRFIKSMPKRITSWAIRQKLNGIKGFHFQDSFDRPVAAVVPETKIVKKKIKKIKKEDE